MPEAGPAHRTPANSGAAFLIHVLTASGAGLGLLALLAAHERRWATMFLWLGVALVVDAVDGPLARKFRVSETLPRWSGEVLDLVVDYLTYVLVPAYALVASGLLPPPLSHAAGFVIVVTGALYFADRRMKTEDAYFRGFPAVWNLIVFYLFLFRPGIFTTSVTIVLFAAMTFIPVYFLHPFRVRRHRAWNLAALVVWVALAATVLLYDMAPPQPVAIAILAIGLYFLTAGIMRNRTL